MSAEAMNADAGPGETVHAVEYAFDERFVRRVLRRAARRRMLWGAAVMAVLFVLAAAVSDIDRRLFLAAGAIAIPLGCVGGYRLRLRLAGGRLYELWSKQAPDRRFRFTFDDAGFWAHAGDSRSRYRWSDVRRLRRHDDLWMLEIAKGIGLFLPPSRASEETRDYVVQRCRAAGVRV